MLVAHCLILLSTYYKLEVMRKFSKIKLPIDFKASDLVLVSILRKRDSSAYYFCFLKLANFLLPNTSMLERS